MSVAVGVADNGEGRVLIAQRPVGKSYAGKWEFPGGKLEPGETVFEALVREFREELGMAVESGVELFRHRHRYPDRHVELHVWQVQQFHGEPRGLEGQAVAWVTPPELDDVDFLEGNRLILEKVQALY